MVKGTVRRLELVSTTVEPQGLVRLITRFYRVVRLAAFRLVQAGLESKPAIDSKELTRSSARLTDPSFLPSSASELTQNGEQDGSRPVW